jgi:N-acetylglutamate synthase-like GNAT family acetyltransferase
MPPIPAMRHTARMAANTIGQFTERGFYLGEFRGRTLGFVLPPGEPPPFAPLMDVFAELTKNETRVVVLAAEPSSAEAFRAAKVAVQEGPTWPARTWRGLRERGRAVVVVGGGEEDFASGVRDAAKRLGLDKLVWLRARGGLCGKQGQPISFMDANELRRHCEAGAGEQADLPLLGEIRGLLEAGIPSVNLCSAEGLDGELFTYSGSGTLFTRERYADVRSLSLDEFDAASGLIARGVAEGYLVPRDEDALDRVLAGGIGVFVEGRHLAGVGALLPHPEANAAEIASLYTVTRYLGGGIGHQIVSFAVERAASAGLSYVFACTTSEQVAAFFERAGFRRVGGESIPVAKWRGYPRERRAKLVCLRLDLAR